MNKSTIRQRQKTRYRQSKTVYKERMEDDIRLQLGIVTDWLYRQDLALSPEAQILYSYIAFASLSKYHKRKVAIGVDELPFKSRRLYKYRDELVALGYIGWHSTKVHSVFWLLEPNYTLKSFKYKGDEVKSEVEIDTIADEVINF